jgi:cyclophilin family peptidyl-prolyl cis-trans isomerase
MKLVNILIIVVLSVFLLNCQEEIKLEEKLKKVTENKPQVIEKKEVNIMNSNIDSITENIMIVMETSMGNIEIELDKKHAPVTVDNFVKYIDQGFFDGTVFHRVIGNFMIQGGGFTPDGNQKGTNKPIPLESNNGLKNNLGTLAMARTNDPNSATGQFFINVKDNDFLNYNPQNPGYAVFGKVVTGLEIVKNIEAVPTTTKKGMRDWPVQDIIIEKVYRK